MEMKIPFSKVTVGVEEQEAVQRVLASGWLAAGPETEAFEQEFSDYISPPGEHYYCIFTNSCTSALKMAYKWALEEAGALGIGWDDDCDECGRSHGASLYYPKNTFCATYSAGEEVGVEMLPHLRHNKANKRVNVHYGGIKDETPCLIEDSAHRIEPNDPLVGKIRCYSFYATKNMTTGSGGMFVTKDKEIYERARLYWKDGLTSSTHDRQTGKSYDYAVQVMAGGYDGNDIAAAMGRVQLRKLPEFTARRNAIRDKYNQAFSQEWQGNHLYPYFVGSEEEVGQLISYLKERGISSGYHYPGTGWLGVSLPIYPLLTDAEVDYISQTIREYEQSKNS